MSKTVTNREIFLAKFLADQNTSEVLAIAMEFAKQKERRQCNDGPSHANNRTK